MFTGIVQWTAEVGSLSNGRLCIETDAGHASVLSRGESVAVNGVCLTAHEIYTTGFCANVSLETLTQTTLGGFYCGDVVNLERSLTPTSLMGGHLVSGHVDTPGVVKSICKDNGSWVFSIRFSKSYDRLVTTKGSICVNGVSLTVNACASGTVEVMVVHHTWEATNFHLLRANSSVNLEFDMIARYLDKLLQQNSFLPVSYP